MAVVPSDMMTGAPGGTAPPGSSEPTVARTRLRPAAALLFAVCAAGVAVTPLGGAASDPIPSPEQFFGFPMGAEGRLAHWDRMVDYFTLVGERSSRVAVREVGRTTLGHPYLLATISTPETIADLPRYQAQQRRLADPRRTSRAEAEAIARDGKAVVLIGANVHATEIGTNQGMNDLLHRLATERSRWVDHVLDNAIVLLIPSQNPDGQRMVVDWYRRNRGTPYEGSPLPELYQPYAGHDNNRDSYMLTQVETRHLNRVLYHEWLPEVYLDKHQMGSAFARIFVPPFKNPPNPNVDPLVWSEVNLLGQAMATRLHEAGKPGVIWGELYSAFWQGANNTNPWWHNMIGLLTETASARLATSVEQDRVDPQPPRGAGRHPRRTRRSPGGSGASLPPPRDTQYRMNYPRPWLGGRWTFADVVEYDRLATEGLLESVASNREMLKRNFFRMNRRTIERFAAGSPFAYLVPAPETQHDPAAATHLLQLLQAEAAEIYVADAPFAAGERRVAAGTYVVPLAQSFGRWVKDLLEPQVYPDIRWPSPRSPRDLPYDVTAWSLGMLMGVETLRVDEPFEAQLSPVAGAVAAPAGRVAGNPAAETWLLAPDSNRSSVAVNRLLAAGASVAWLRAPLDVAGADVAATRRIAPGTLVVRDAAPALVADVARKVGVQLEGRDLPAGATLLPLRSARLGVFEPWGGNRDAGWTRWVLEQHEFPYRRLRNADLRAPDLHDRFDVVILPEMGAAALIRGLRSQRVRPEYRGGIGVDGIRNLRRFVQAGGTLITLGNSARIAMDHLETPLTDRVRGARPGAFLAPGSIVRVAVDTEHPIGYGMPPEADAMFVGNGAYVSSSPSAVAATTAVVRYPNAPLLRSGWLIGEERLRGTGAVLEVRDGRGRIILHTFRVQHRGQTWGTFKLLFNAIRYGAALSPPATAPASPAVPPPPPPAGAEGGRQAL